MCIFFVFSDRKSFVTTSSMLHRVMRYYLLWWKSFTILSFIKIYRWVEEWVLYINYLDLDSQAKCWTVQCIGIVVSKSNLKEREFIRDSLWELPVSILEFSMMIFDDSAMSIPSVFGLSFGAIICSLEMCEPWHAFKLIWFLGLLIWVNSLRIRFSQAWKCKAWVENNQVLI